MKKGVMCAEGMENLRLAVLNRAIDDYKCALKTELRTGNNCTERKVLEKWFRSDWGQNLSGNQGEEIIKRCRKHMGMEE